MANISIFYNLLYRNSSDCAILYSQGNEKWLANILVSASVCGGIYILKNLKITLSPATRWVFYAFDLEKSGGKIARNMIQNKTNSPNNPKASPYQGTGLASP